MNWVRLHTPLFLIVCIVCTLTACGGGGGGGGEFTGPAIVNVSSSATTIDTGDRVNVTVYIQEVNPDGIVLKIRTPLGLSYIVDSGSLTVNNIQLNIDPTANKADSTHNYLVYFLNRSIFGENNMGEVRVIFEGTAEIAEGEIEVDSDIDNPEISNTTEFDVTAPKFSAEDAQAIIVTN